MNILLDGMGLESPLSDHEFRGVTGEGLRWRGKTAIGALPETIRPDPDRPWWVIWQRVTYSRPRWSTVTAYYGPYDLGKAQEQQKALDTRLAQGAWEAVEAEATHRVQG